MSSLVSPAGLLVALNLLAFLAWGLDKRAAIRGRRRVPESRLILLALAGGAIGAWAGVLLFRHKTAKRSFQLRLVPASLVGLLVAYWLL